MKRRELLTRLLAGTAALTLPMPVLDTLRAWATDVWRGILVRIGCSICRRPRQQRWEVVSG